MKLYCDKDKCKKDERYPIFFRSIVRSDRIDENGEVIDIGYVEEESVEYYCGICSEEIYVEE